MKLKPLTSAAQALFLLGFAASVTAQSTATPDKAANTSAPPTEIKAEQKAISPARNPIAPFEPAKRIDTSPKPNESDDEKKVRTRSQKRWEFLVKGEIDQAYAYLSPGTRQLSSPEAYKATIRPGIWKGGKVGRISCDEPELCYVDVTVLVKVVAGRAGIIDQESQVKETWVKSGDNWWFLPKS
jgi:hypothetical protein